MAVESKQIAARARRQREARKYKPSSIDLLLVAEAPPQELSRYFYFEEVTVQDSLFRYVAREVLGVEPTRANKAELLVQLRDRGVFLIDLKPDPEDGSPLTDYVSELVRRCQELRPAKIILIKVTLYDVAYASLARAELPVVNERIPFPGSGRQHEFELAFRRSLGEQPDQSEA